MVPRMGSTSELEAAVDEAPPPAPLFHPNAAELYRRKVEGLHESLNANETRDEAIEALRGLIDQVVIRPVEGGLEIELIGEIANMLSLTQGAHAKTAAPRGAAVHDRFQSSVKVVAGAGFEPATFRL